MSITPYTDLERELQAQIKRLTAECDALRELMNCYNLGGWTDSLALIQERDALRADALRYLWLKDNKASNNEHCWHFQNGPVLQPLSYLDAAIDAAMKGEQV